MCCGKETLWFTGSTANPVALKSKISRHPFYSRGTSAFTRAVYRVAVERFVCAILVRPFESGDLENMQLAAVVEYDFVLSVPVDIVRLPPETITGVTPVQCLFPAGRGAGKWKLGYFFTQVIHEIGPLVTCRREVENKIRAFRANPLDCESPSSSERLFPQVRTRSRQHMGWTLNTFLRDVDKLIRATRVKTSDSIPLQVFSFQYGPTGVKKKRSVLSLGSGFC